MQHINNTHLKSFSEYIQENIPNNKISTFKNDITSLQSEHHRINNISKINKIITDKNVSLERL